MPTRYTEVARCSGIRNSGRGPGGKRDRPDRTSGPPPALLRSSRKSPRPECASEAPWGPFAPKMPSHCLIRSGLGRTFFSQPDRPLCSQSIHVRASRTAMSCSTLTPPLPRASKARFQPQRPRSPHPILARVMLAENLAGLFCKTPVNSCLQLVAVPMRLRPTLGPTPFRCFAHRGSTGDRAGLLSMDDLDRVADRKTEVTVRAPQIDGNFGKPVRILIPERLARR
jgi:hypothetical protein